MLLHGGLSDSRVWRRQFDELSSHYTVIAWDAPGCGQSSDPPEIFRLSDYADSLAFLLEEIGVENPHVLGISFGGGLALEFYNRYPEVPQTLILVSAYAGWAGSLPPEDVKSRLEAGLKQSRESPEQIIQAWMPTFFSSSVPQEVIDETATIMADVHPVGMRAMLRAFAEADLRHVLPQITIPTLLLYGSADVRSPVSIANNLHAQIPTSDLIIVPEIGHVINLEAPDAFNTEVAQFLSRYT